MRLLTEASFCNVNVHDNNVRNENIVGGCNQDLATYPVTSKDVEMPSGPDHLRSVDMSFKGFTVREFIASASEQTRSKNSTKAKIEAKEEVEGILAE